MINKEKCSGCSACENTCPVNAIEIKIDDLTGFNFANIDVNKCINCDKCDDVCPHNAYVLDEYKSEKYALQASEEIRKVSSSGGAFTVLANYYTQLGYKIVGVQWDKDWHAEYAIAESEEEWHKFRGSKYMQPNVKDIFPKIKKLLDNNDKVLFVGVPCYVKGLLNFLGKKYNNLVTVDLLCGSYPSPLAWDKWYEYQNIDKENIKNINMRAKQKQGNRTSIISIEGKDGKKFDIFYKNKDDFNPADIVWERKYSLPVCHDCIYKKKENRLNRVADYTIGDLWNSKITCPDLHDEMESQVGTFLCNSIEAKKVLKIIENCQDINIKKIKYIKSPHNYEKRDNEKNFNYLHKLKKK